PAIGSVLAALPHEAFRVPAAALIALVRENVWPEATAHRLAGVGLLERGWWRANRASWPVYRLSARASLGHNDRFRVDGLGCGAALPSLDPGANLHGPRGPRRQEAPDPCPSPVALESVHQDSERPDRCSWPDRDRVPCRVRRSTHWSIDC